MDFISGRQPSGHLFAYWHHSPMHRCLLLAAIFWCITGALIISSLSVYVSVFATGRIVHRIGLLSRKTYWYAMSFVIVIISVPSIRPLTDRYDVEVRISRLVDSNEVAPAEQDSHKSILINSFLELQKAAALDCTLMATLGQQHPIGSRYIVVAGFRRACCFN